MRSLFLTLVAAVSAFSLLATPTQANDDDRRARFDRSDRFDRSARFYRPARFYGPARFYRPARFYPAPVVGIRFALPGIRFGFRL
jgi:hypothetical protein